MSREGNITQSVEVRPWSTDSNLVAGEVLLREIHTVNPFDNVFTMEHKQHFGLQRVVNAEAASLYASPVAETVDNVRRQHGLSERIRYGNSHHRGISGGIK